MEEILNFRDFGGYKTSHGKTMKTGLFYRSAHLGNATVRDLEKLKELGIKTVVDLRSQAEVDRRPDRLPSDSEIQYIHLPMKAIRYDAGGFLYKMASGIMDEIRDIDYEKVCVQAYKEYVTDFKPEYTMLLNLLKDADNVPLLFHCTAGKDRTGIGAALIQLILGVPLASIMDDYLESNDHLKRYQRDIMQKFQFFRKLGMTGERFQPLFDARESYLAAALNQIQPEFSPSHKAVQEEFGISKIEYEQLIDQFLD